MRYRLSQAGWVGRLPSHWSEARMRFVAEINPSKSEAAHVSTNTEVSFLPMEAVGEDGSVDLSRTKPISEVSSGYTYFRNGDVLVAKITPCFENGKAAQVDQLTAGLGFGSTEFHVLRPRIGLDDGFLLHLVRSAPFREAGTASMYGAAGQKRVPTNFIADFVVPLPPAQEQARIAAFLDRETDKIDKLIAKQTEFLTRLDEHRRAVITEAVASGISPEAVRAGNTSKEYPAHWKLKPLKLIFHIAGGATPSKAEPRFWEGDVPWVTPKDMKVDVVTQSEDTLSRDVLTEGRISLHPVGSILIVVRGMILAKRVPVAETAVPVTVNQDMKVLTLKMPGFPRFFRYLLGVRSDLLDGLIEEAGHGTKTLRTDLFANVLIPFPPAREQKIIADSLDRHLVHLDQVYERCSDAMQLLRERRAALIAATITGQIDVAEPTLTVAAA